MRVTGVELSSDNANVFSFGTSEVASTDKYLIKTIVGLDADEISRKFYGFGAQTNSKFYRYGVTKREIVLRVVLNPNYSINESFSEIRDELYRTISASRTGLINLLFTGGGAALATISGYISKFEVPYFSKTPELQITIQCPDPMLRGYSPVEYEQGEIASQNPLIISDSLSTAPHGFSFEVEFITNTDYFLIQSDETSPDWTFKVFPDGGFQSGDRLVFSGEYGDKKLYVDNGLGQVTYLMDRIEPGSIWPIIFPGTNEFYIEDVEFLSWYALSYYPAYWGI